MNRTDNEIELLRVFMRLANKHKDKEYLIDKSGVKTVEILAPRIILHPAQMSFDLGFRKTNDAYVKKELEWYLSEDLNIHPHMDDVALWNDVSDLNGFINSNYGNLVFSEDNGNQFLHVLTTLTQHRDSRQAIIIYQRPSMHVDWDIDGRRDFVCTNFQHFFIRDNELVCITSMRSCDAIFGMMNDIPWFHYVIQTLHDCLRTYYKYLELGEHIYIPNSLHVYERHFHLLDEALKIGKGNNEKTTI